MNDGSEVRGGHPHFQEWVKRHKVNTDFAILAHQIVLAVPMVEELMGYWRNSKIIDALPKRPENRTWLKLYRNHKISWAKLGSALFDDQQWGSNAAYALGQARFLENWRKTKSSELFTGLSDEKLAHLLQEAVTSVTGAYRDNLRTISELTRLTDIEEDAIAQRVAAALPVTPDLVFFWAVAIPCLVYCQTIPIKLLRHARRGREEDIDFIEWLIRIDPETVHDRRIDAWIKGDSEATYRNRRRLIGEWSEKGVQKSIGATHLKYSCAALISVLSERLNRGCAICADDQPVCLTARQIQELFDAVAFDRAPEQEEVELNEIDLASFRKGMSRHAEGWKELLRRGAQK